MPEFFDYNPHNGVRERWDFDESTGKAYFRHEQDVSGVLQAAAETRAVGSCNKGLMDSGKEFHCFAILPATVQIEMRTKGLDLYSRDPSMQRRCLQEIERNYAQYKVTDKYHVR